MGESRVGGGCQGAAQSCSHGCPQPEIYFAERDGHPHVSSHCHLPSPCERAEVPRERMQTQRELRSTSHIMRAGFSLRMTSLACLLARSLDRLPARSHKPAEFHVSAESRHGDLDITPAACHDLARLNSAFASLQLVLTRRKWQSTVFVTAHHFILFSMCGKFDSCTLQTCSDMLCLLGMPILIDPSRLHGVAECGPLAVAPQDVIPHAQIVQPI